MFQEGDNICSCLCWNFCLWRQKYQTVLQSHIQCFSVFTRRFFIHFSSLPLVVVRFRINLTTTSTCLTPNLNLNSVQKTAYALWTLKTQNLLEKQAFKCYTNTHTHTPILLFKMKVVVLRNPEGRWMAGWRRRKR